MKKHKEILGKSELLRIIHRFRGNYPGPNSLNTRHLRHFHIDRNINFLSNFFTNVILSKANGCSILSKMWVSRHTIKIFSHFLLEYQNYCVIPGDFATLRGGSGASRLHPPLRFAKPQVSHKILIPAKSGKKLDGISLIHILNPKKYKYYFVKRN